MRTLGMVAVAGLAAAALVEGAMLLGLRRDMAAMGRRVASLESGGENPASAPVHVSGSAPLSPSPDREAVRRAWAAPAPPLAPAPIFAAAAPVETPAATPAAPIAAASLTTPEGLAALEQALGALKDRSRQQKFDRSVARDAEVERRLRAGAYKELGLAPAEERTFLDALGNLESKRRSAVDAYRAGVRSLGETKDQVDAAEKAAEQQARALLGDKRMKQLRDILKRERKAVEQSGQAQQPENPPGP